MQLDQITANIRLRNPWEAIDLGFALIRHSWREHLFALVYSVIHISGHYFSGCT